MKPMLTLFWAECFATDLGREMGKLGTFLLDIDTMLKFCRKVVFTLNFLNLQTFW